MSIPVITTAWNLLETFSYILHATGSLSALVLVLKIKFVSYEGIIYEFGNNKAER
jgi:hypothetical protein